MPAIAPVLSNIMIQKVAENIKKLSGKSPLETPASKYFSMMFTAISTGIATGTTNLTVTTEDTGFMGLPPVPGVGTGTGIEIDSNYMSQLMYTNIRNEILKKYNDTTHSPWIPGVGNSGEYLKAITDGISDAIKEHYKTCWTITTNHIMIYSGNGIIDPKSKNAKNFQGVSSSNIKSLIISNAPLLKGQFFPTFVEAISKSYQDALETTSKAEVTIIGVCIPLIPPAGAQICGLPGVGTGSGTII